MKTWNILCAVLIAIPIVTGAASWSMDGADGPSNWYKSYSDCNKQVQSPIDYKSSEITYNQSLGSFTLTGYTDVNTTLEMTNKNFALKVSLGAEKKANLSGGSLPGVFTLVQYHMHWGNSSKDGSEHTVGGVAYPMEMHFVHYNTKYPNISEALNHWDGLAVLGVFFEESANDNANLSPMLDHISNVTNDGEKVSISKFDLMTIMPSNKAEFYRNNGSLTTPGCQEAVTWTVFKNRLTISKRQLDLLRTLKDSKNATIVKGYRPVQAVNGRTIYATFAAPPTTATPPAEGGKEALAAALLTVLLCALISLGLKN